MSNQTQPAQPLSSAEYLEMMRKKRQERRSTPTQTNSSQTTTQVKNNPSPPISEEDLFPGIAKPIPKTTIISWNAPSRPFKKRDRQYYVTISAIVFLISLILFFAGQFLPIAVVISVGFLAYVMSSVPPQNVNIEINTYGIEIEDLLYYWEEMGRFWTEEKLNQEVLMIETARFPGRVMLVFEADKKEELKNILAEVLLEEKPAETFYEKAAKWLQEKIPLEIGS